MEKIRQKRRGGTGRCDKGGQGRHCCGTMLRRRCAGRTVLLRQRDGSPCSLRAGGNCSMPEPAPALRASPVMAAPAGGASSLHPMPVRPILTGSGTGPAGRLQSVPGIVASLSPEQGYFQSIPEGPQGIAPDIAQHFMPRSGRVFCGWRYPDGRPRIPRPAGSTSDILPLKAPVSQDPVLVSRVSCLKPELDPASDRGDAGGGVAASPAVSAKRFTD